MKIEIIYTKMGHGPRGYTEWNSDISYNHFKMFIPEINPKRKKSDVLLLNQLKTNRNYGSGAGRSDSPMR